MENKYNVLINYLGEGEFKFIVKKIGEVSITRHRPVYIYNADVDTINNLRTLRRLLIEITIGAKPSGAYKIYNLDEINREKDRLFDNRVSADRRGYESVSNNEVKSILSSGTNGPIMEETVEVKEPVKEEIKTEEPKKEVKKTTTKKSTTKKSTKKSTKK